MLDPELRKLIMWGPKPEDVELAKLAAAQRQAREVSESRGSESLESLVNIFSDPYEFVRELVQNAMDAQVEAGVDKPIELFTEFQRYEDSCKGLFYLHVVDKGIGMCLTTINKYLTCIHVSSKANDPRLVGEHGLGFISTFAFCPNAIIVDTGRNEEYTRVVFQANRKFDRINLLSPVVGTAIQVIKEIRFEELAEIEDGIERCLRGWCSLVPTELRFNGEIINEDFLFKSEWVESGSVPESRFCLKLREEGEPAYEIYRHGFLIERGSRGDLNIPGFRYRLDTQHAHFTIARDSVQKDEQLRSTVAKIRKRALGPCLDVLLERASSQDKNTDEVLGILSHHLQDLSARRASVPLILAADGSKLSIAELCRLRRGNTIDYATKEDKRLRIPLRVGPSPGFDRLVTQLDSYKRTSLGRLANQYLAPSKLKLKERR